MRACGRVGVGGCICPLGWRMGVCVHENVSDLGCLVRACIPPTPGPLEKKRFRLFYYPMGPSW